MSPTRIDDLRRRLHDDPSSIAFAQLAEELRRAGQLEEAIVVCRTGLASCPDHVSARVTLGRSLAGLGRIEEASRELEAALQLDPDHRGAARALAEIRAGSPHLPAALRPSTEGPGATASAPSTEPGPSDGDRPAGARGAIDPAEYLRIVRTLAALESWLAAIHVTRAGRHP